MLRSQEVSGSPFGTAFLTLYNGIGGNSEEKVLAQPVIRGSVRMNMSNEHTNPKLEEHPGSNAEKDPGNWVSGAEPMTGAQASYLTTLCEEAGVEAPSGEMSKADASRKIDELRAKLGKDD